MEHSILIEYNFKHFIEWKFYLYCNHRRQIHEHNYRKKSWPHRHKHRHFYKDLKDNHLYLKHVSYQMFIIGTVSSICDNVLMSYTFLKETILFTDFTFFSSITLRTNASIWTNTISAGSVIFTWRGFTFVNI